ncbi:hypothetical protein CR513_25672, partial [Mucuna pruriens]
MKKNMSIMAFQALIINKASSMNLHVLTPLLTFTYLINQISSCVLSNVSLIQFMISLFPSTPIMQNLEPQLDPQAVKCVFLGYAPNKRGYKCYHLSSHRYFVSMDTTFHGHMSFFTCPQIKGESNNLISGFEFLPLGPLFLIHLREKPDLVQKQLQSSNSEVSIEINPSNSQILDACDLDPYDLPIAF